MMSNKQLSAVIELEEKLFYRQDSTAALAELLDEEFSEIGSLNHIYNKHDLIKELEFRSEDALRTAKNFKAREISNDVIQLTYICFIRESMSSPVRSSYRSSIWRLKDGQWKLFFHQGSPYN
jgi:hypothetical protein